MDNWNLTRYLSRSIAFMAFGSNDYINNYLMPNLYTSRFRYTSNQFANHLLNSYTRQLLVSCLTSRFRMKSHSKRALIVRFLNFQNKIRYDFY